MPEKFSNGYSLYGHYINSPKGPNNSKITQVSFGQKAAEKVASIVGSWIFILAQTAVLSIWIILNILLVAYAWDPYPFILVNLFLSLQAAYTAPMILMAQNRQNTQDRNVLYDGWKTDRRTNEILCDMELELDNRLIGQEKKIDELIEQEEKILNILEKKEENGKYK